MAKTQTYCAIYPDYITRLVKDTMAHSGTPDSKTPYMNQLHLTHSTRRIHSSIIQSFPFTKLKPCTVLQFLQKAIDGRVRQASKQAHKINNNSKLLTIAIPPNLFLFMVPTNWGLRGSSVTSLFDQAEFIAIRWFT